jgi:PAS domain-containing protein
MISEEALAAIAAPSGYEALLAIDRSVLEAIPAAVYVCAADGVIVRFNRRATELWGRAPAIGDTDERFCGSLRLYDLGGDYCRTRAHRWRLRFVPADRNATRKW